MPREVTPDTVIKEEPIVKKEEVPIKEEPIVKKEEVPSRLKRKRDDPKKSAVQQPVEDLEAEVKPSQDMKQKELTVYAGNEAHEIHVLEKGEATFLIRPKVMTTKATTLDQVNKLYLLLKPDQGVPLGHERIIIIPKKGLPLQGALESCFAFVSVAGEQHEVEQTLQEEHYTTKTRGERFFVAAHVICKARYEIVLKTCSHGKSTYLLYDVSTPDLDPFAHSFNIQQDGSFFIKVKNPLYSDGRKGTPMGFQAKNKASFPPELTKHFAGKRKRAGGDAPRPVRWADLNPVSFLDVPHAELLLVATKGAALQSQLAHVAKVLALADRLETQLANRPLVNSKPESGQVPNP